MIWRALAAAVLAGTASAFLLWALDRAGEWFGGHRCMVGLLPVAGWVTLWLGERTGAVFLGTVLTHVCGGSAGREGAAVQVGGAMATAVKADVRVGMAAGFGGVFGTPWAGFVFAQETAGQGAIWVCLAGALVGDWVARGWGAEHTVYAISVWPEWWAVGWVGVAGLAFGMAAAGYRGLVELVRRHVPVVVGGVIVAVVLYSTSAWEFAGLGVPKIAAAFAGPAGAWDWLVKLALTAVTVGSGFRGGEATPLFFVGATLGNVMSGPMGVPMSWLAALGFVAVFGAAAKAPLASTVMAVELFGPVVIPYALVACFTADFASRRAQSFWVDYSSRS